MSLTPIRLATALFGLALLAPALPAAPAQQPQAQPVYVEPVRSETVQQTERVLGSLRARSVSVMAALEEGVLLELAVREADKVAAGDVLARQDTRRLEASRIQLSADLAMADATALERTATLANAKQDLAALERAAGSGAVSDQDLRRARTAVATGQALVQAAEQQKASLQAAIDLVDIRIADAVVRAPFAARVTTRHAEVGQWIRPGEPLVTLVSTGPLEAWLDCPERFTASLDRGADSYPVHLEATGADVEGVRARSVPMVDVRARTFPLVLDIPAEAVQAARLQPGMSISCRIPLGAPTERLVLATDAVVRRGDASLVAKVGEGGIAELVPVRVLFDAPGGFAVESLVPGGLAGGDLVVIEGNERLYPGTPVAPMERPAEGGAPTDAGGEAPTEGQPSTDAPESAETTESTRG